MSEGQDQSAQLGSGVGTQEGVQQGAVKGADQGAENMKKSVFVLGYTGETGKALVKELIGSDAIKRLVLIGRREVTLDNKADKIEQKVVDFERLDDQREAFTGCDAGYCCLGTTRGKAGKEGFVKVDYDYVVGAARVAKETGCAHFHVVSSQGADQNSWFLYTKTKGQAEEAIKQMGFARYSVYRPAMLMCDREESRFGEAALRTLLKPVQALAPTLATTPTHVLARAMLHCTLHDTRARVDVFNNKDIFRLADMSYFKEQKY